MGSHLLYDSFLLNNSISHIMSEQNKYPLKMQT